MSHLNEEPPRISLSSDDGQTISNKNKVHEESDGHPMMESNSEKNINTHSILIKNEVVNLEQQSTKSTSSSQKRRHTPSFRYHHHNSIKSMSKYSVSAESPRKLAVVSTHVEHHHRVRKSRSDFTPISASLNISPVTNNTTLFMKIHCSFCGGQHCKYEDYLRTIPSEAQKREFGPQIVTPRKSRKFWAFEGLNSHYVVHNVIASQRPSSRLIKKFDIVGQFKHNNVISIVNLQERGEHPYCGDGILEKTGFSYDPEEDLMRHKINYYNYSFPDMSIPDMNLMTSVVKSMKMDAERGKILVHCHAGLGRTGLVICCYLIYCKYFHSPIKAIEFVRSKRPGSIQTKSQVQFVSEFYSFLTTNRTFFYSATLKLAMDKQRTICCGTEYLQLQRTPKLVFEICSKISHILFAANDLNQLLTNFFLFSPDTISRDLEALKTKINMDDWLTLRKSNHFSTLIYLLFDWVEGFEPPIIDCLLDCDPHEDLSVNLKIRGLFVEVEIVNTLVKCFSQMFRRMTNQPLAESFVLLFLYKLCKTTLGTNEDIVKSFIRQMRRGTIK